MIFSAHPSYDGRGVEITRPEDSYAAMVDSAYHTKVKGVSLGVIVCRFCFMMTRCASLGAMDGIDKGVVPRGEWPDVSE